MTIDLSKVEFQYDFFSSTMPDGSLLILNKVDEDMASAINILIATDTEVRKCSPIIGMGNDKIMLYTEYKEYEGQCLNKDNIGYCFIDMFEGT